MTSNMAHITPSTTMIGITIGENHPPAILVMTIANVVVAGQDDPRGPSPLVPFPPEAALEPGGARDTPNIGSMIIKTGKLLRPFGSPFSRAEG